MKIHIVSFLVVASALSSCILMPEYWEVKKQQQIQADLNAKLAQNDVQLGIARAKVSQLKSEINALQKKLRQQLAKRKAAAEAAAAESAAAAADAAEIEKLKQEIEIRKQELRKLYKDNAYIID